MRQGYQVDNSIPVQPLTWLFPRRCLLCLQALGTGWWCDACRDTLPYITTRCPCCGIALSSTRTCGACQRRPPQFDATLAPLAYQSPIDRLIHQFKYRNRLALTLPLASLIAGSLDAATGLPDVLLPVPLHGRRLRRRGYNQSAELARALGNLLGVPVDYHWVVRTRATSTQAELPLPNRRANLKGAFAVTRAAPYRHVALVDDVMTSGATVDEMARVVRADAAERVEVWVVARA